MLELPVSRVLGVLDEVSDLDRLINATAAVDIVATGKVNSNALPVVVIGSIYAVSCGDDPLRMDERAGAEGVVVALVDRCQCADSLKVLGG